MSTEDIQDNGDDGESAPEQQDPMTNIKAEFSRKQSNLETKLAETNAQLERMMALVQSQATQAAPAQPGKSTRDILFDDPDQFIEQVTSKAEKRADARVQAQAQSQAEMQTAILELQAKFPEFAQGNSEATLKAIEIGNRLPARLRGTPEGAKMAILEAASELGLVPAARRQSRSNDGEPVGKGGSSKTAPAAGKAKVDDAAIQLAQLLGVDVSDPKRVAGIAAAQKRNRWTRYE